MSAEPITEQPTAVEPTTTTTEATTTTTDAVESTPATTEVNTEGPSGVDKPKEDKAITEKVKDSAADASKKTTTAVVDAPPVTEGTLGYKAPGLIKYVESLLIASLQLTNDRSLRFSKHHFWIGSAALDDTAISHYVRSDKSPDAYKNAAFASQTGKGLLLWSKHVEDKGLPVGIINLVSRRQQQLASTKKANARRPRSTM
jgi:Pleckstrin homology domain